MANPALNFRNSPRRQTDCLTINGVLEKLVILLLLVLSGSLMTWQMGVSGDVNQLHSATVMGCLAGFCVALATICNPTMAWLLGPLYAVLEGLALGGISFIFEAQYPGIVLQAFGCTMATAWSMLFLYRTGLVKVTESFTAGIVSATGGICVIYLGAIILQVFGIPVPFLRDATPLGIAISVIISGVAAMNLILDFDLVAKAARDRVSKDYEWYASFGMVLTLVWLYLEILDLIRKIRSE